MGIGNVGKIDNAMAAYSVTWRPATPAEISLGRTEDGEPVKGRNVKEKADSSSVSEVAKKGECQACKERKYMDGSDEQVSFKSPASINPNAVYARVRGHEQEHVVNAYDKAKEGGGKVMNASVSIHYATCPECGRRYVSGGTTHTSIKYPKDSYGQNKKAFDAEATKGNNVDLAV